MARVALVGPSQSFGVYPALSMRAAYAPPNRRWPMILNALVEKLKRRSKDDFKGRHYEATLILQAVSWYLRYPLSYRDIEELFLERGLEVDHSTRVAMKVSSSLNGCLSTSSLMYLGRTGSWPGRGDPASVAGASWLG